MTVVDIGANIGFSTILLSNLVGNKGKVYSFEPDKTNFHFLKRNTKNRKNVSLQNLAVGNKDGSTNLYLSKNFNVNHRCYDAGENNIVKKVKCVTLDKFFGTKKRIDLIKIDIEGFDYYATLGARNLIKKQKKIAIFGELWPYGLRKAGTSVQEYLALLKGMNLKVIYEIPKNFGQLEKLKNYYTNFIAFK
jgi:FkbM family methyltransferase